MKTFEQIEQAIRNKSEPKLRHIYDNLKAKTYFEDYEGYTERAENDIREVFSEEFGKCIITVNNISVLVDIHLGIIDEVAQSKEDWFE